MSSDKAQLLGMGFEAARVDWSLQATSNAGLQPALDHLLANMDNPIPSSSSSSSAPAPATGVSQHAEDLDDDDQAALAAHVAKMGGKPGAGQGEDMARSVKCSDCGKIFKNTSLVSFHAEKSGHSNFEESTEEFVPLTEEQKKEKLADLKAKLAEKRAKQATEDVAANKANEALRRKAGKDQGQAKEAMKIKEAERAAAQKAKDKIADAKAKAAIKAQIEADKKARAEKAAREKALRDGTAPTAESEPVTVAKPGAAAPAAAGASGSGSGAAMTRLQVRLSKPGVAPMVKAFPSESPLSEVAEWIASEHLEYDVQSIKFSTTFPRKVFGPGDMSKSLKENGLTPSAVLMAA